MSEGAASGAEPTSDVGASADGLPVVHQQGAEADGAKRRRHIIYYTRQVPLLRLLGMAMLGLVVLLHNHFILGDAGGYLTFAIPALAYSLVSWAVTLALFERCGGFDLGTFFLAVDVLWFTYAIHASGGDRSLLFFLLLVRVADQTNTTFRRVLLFLQLSVASYIGLLLIETFVDHRPPRWPVELAKLAAVYLTGVYVATTARTAEHLRRRTTEAIRMARGLVDKLRLQSASLERARNQAEAASRAKTEFLANVGHELRTPLTGVMGFTELILDGDVTAEQREHLATVQRCGENLLAIVNQLLELARQEGPAPQLDARPFHLGELADGLLAEVAGPARDKGLALSRQLSLDLPAQLEGDPARLRQALLPLLQNAVKFTPAGSVTLGGRVAEAAGDVVTVELSVRDTGIGIADDQQRRIFEAFSQVEGSTQRHHEGTGLGLAVARRNVDLMKGRLWVESKPGAGAAFFVSLPLVRATGS